MKANLDDRCYLLSRDTASIAKRKKDNDIQNSNSENLLVLTLDNKLIFDNHLQKVLIYVSIIYIWAFPKGSYLWIHSLYHNLTTDLLCGCAIVVWSIIRTIEYIKNALSLNNYYIKTICHHTHKKFTSICDWNVYSF